MIAKEVVDGQSSLQIGPSRPQEANKFGWIKHLHGNMWIIFHSLRNIALGSLKRGGSNAKPRIVASNQVVIGS